MGTDLFLQFYGWIHLIESKLEYRNPAVCHLSVYLLKLSYENFLIYQLAVNTVVGFEEGVCHETAHRECPGCSLKYRFCTGCGTLRVATLPNVRFAILSPSLKATTGT